MPSLVTLFIAAVEAAARNSWIIAKAPLNDLLDRCISIREDDFKLSKDGVDLFSSGDGRIRGQFGYAD